MEGLCQDHAIHGRHHLTGKDKQTQWAKTLELGCSNTLAQLSAVHPLTTKESHACTHLRAAQDGRTHAACSVTQYRHSLIRNPRRLPANDVRVEQVLRTKRMAHPQQAGTLHPSGNHRVWIENNLRLSGTAELIQP